MLQKHTCNSATSKNCWNVCRFTLLEKANYTSLPSNAKAVTNYVYTCNNNCKIWWQIPAYTIHQCVPPLSVPYGFSRFIIFTLFISVKTLKFSTWNLFICLWSMHTFTHTHTYVHTCMLTCIETCVQDYVRRQNIELILVISYNYQSNIWHHVFNLAKGAYNVPYFFHDLFLSKTSNLLPVVFPALLPFLKFAPPQCEYS
jgi:hypothetical protein